MFDSSFKYSTLVFDVRALLDSLSARNSENVHMWLYVRMDLVSVVGLLPRGDEGEGSRVSLFPSVP